MKKYVVVIMAILLLVGCTQKPIEPPTKEDYTKEFIGDWHGTMRLEGKDVPIEAYLTPETAEILWTTKEQQKSIFTQITYEANLVKGTVMRDGQEINIQGSMKDNRLEGTYQIGEQTLPFVLVRGELVVEQKEELFTVDVKGGQLKTTLLSPQLPVMPLYIIIGGVGPTTKDGNLEGLAENNSYLQLAELLAEEHIATIRFDKRGVGENNALQEAEERTTFVDFIDDVVAIVEAARKDERFNEVNLIGHSEGSLIALNVAQQQPIDRLISLVGAGRPIDEVLLEQLQARLAPDVMAEAKVIIDNLKQGQRVEVVSEPLQSLFRPSLQPYMASWMKLNPQTTIADLTMPILIVGGTTDLQVPITDSELLKQAQPEATLAIIEGMNHILKEAPLELEGNRQTYTAQDLPLHPNLVEEIIAFIQ